MISTIFIKGILLGLGYVMPIGAQNLFVINQAIVNDLRRSILTTLMVIFADISLALACFYGSGYIATIHPIIGIILQLAGALFLIKVSYSLFFQEISEVNARPSQGIMLSSLKSAFVLTWFNPQALVDGSLLLGGMKSSLDSNQEMDFIFGVSFASFLWFMSLCIITNKSTSSLTPNVLSRINKFCATTLFGFGAYLLISGALKAVDYADNV